MMAPRRNDQHTNRRAPWRRKTKKEKKKKKKSRLMCIYSRVGFFWRSLVSVNMYVLFHSSKDLVLDFWNIVFSILCFFSFLLKKRPATREWRSETVMNVKRQHVPLHSQLSCLLASVTFSNAFNPSPKEILRIIRSDFFLLLTAFCHNIPKGKKRFPKIHITLSNRAPESRAEQNRIERRILIYTKCV